MSSTVLDERGHASPRRRWLVGLSAAALAVAMSTTGIPVANAVHDTGAFELDGNATNASGTSGTSGDDWDNVCYQVAIAGGAAAADAAAQCTATAPTSTATAVSWVAEANLNASIFTGGGSKDPQDISSWAWKDGAGGLPDKDNLLHSFAARYSLTPSTTCPGGGNLSCDVLFFGSDRYDNSGDAQQGFWFFQNKITQGTTPVGGGTGFTGVHKNGDLLVISNFSNGGTTSTITVYAWNSLCTKAGALNGRCSDVNLEILETSDAAKCASTLATGDPFCGIVNPSTTTSPWSFKDKSASTSFLNGELYEGGINLSTLGLSGECFASVASETRSSTSTTATLKDFVLGEFGDCSSHITTTPKFADGSVIPGLSTSIGTGTVAVKDTATLTVGGVASWTGNVAFSLCGPLSTPAASSNCTTGGTAIGTSIPVTNTTSMPISSAPATISRVGTYCWRADFTSTKTGVPNASDGSSTECFTVTPVTPTLDTQAGPDVTVGSMVTDTATLTGTANKPGTPEINPTTAGGVATGSITFTLYKDDCTTQVGDSITVAVGNLEGGGRGAVAESDALTEAGTYHWVASYSGDAPNTLGTTHNTACDDTDEDVVVGASAVVTTPQNGDGSAALTSTSITTSGSVAVRDSAEVTISGFSTWTGTLAFHLCGPLTTVPAASDCSTGGTLIGDPITVTQDTDEPVLGPQATVTSAGTYCWRADFDSGTTGVPDASDGTSGECFAITPVTPELSTTAGPDVPVGSTVTDTATLTGTANKPGSPVINPTTAGAVATGSITFTLYEDDCTTQVGDSITVDVVDLEGGGRGAVATSGALTEPGTYHWVASYSGDAPNTLGATHNTACDDVNEDVVVSGSSLVTTPKDAAGTTTVTSTSITTAGQVTVRDSAVLTVTGLTTWSGSVAFSLCGPPATDCATGGTSAGAPVAVSNTGPAPVLGPQVTIHAAGTYCWRADFTSSTTGVPNASDGTSGECFTVTPVTPTLGTNAGAAVDLGGAITDSAVLTGAALRPDGSFAGGKITFRLFGPSTTGCGPEVTTGFGIEKDVVTFVSGGVTYRGAQITAADDVVPLLPGTYHWVASYSGDSPNTLGADHNTACTDSLEDVIVNQFQPSIATAQSWVPNDTATLTVDGGGDLTGSITFQLFDNNTCEGDPLYDSGAIAVDGASPQHISTTNQTALTASATVSWLVTYASDNIAHLGVTSTCHLEHSVLTITNS